MNGECDGISETLPKRARLTNNESEQRARDGAVEDELDATGEGASRKIESWVKAELQTARSLYEQLALECYYLQNGGTLCDLDSWAARASSKTKVRDIIPPELCSQVDSALLATRQASASSVGETVAVKCEPQAATKKPKRPSQSDNSNATVSEKRPRETVVSTQRPAKTSSEQTSRTAWSTEPATAQEQSSHELRVLQRVRELRAHGVWSLRRLPKVLEPRRARTHRDMLLEEMQWLATDVMEERQWKQLAARRIAAAVQRYFREAEQRHTAACREAEQRARRGASKCAGHVREFWRNAATLAESKRQLSVERSTRGQRYAVWLNEGLTGRCGASRYAPTDASDDESISSLSEQERAEMSYADELRALQNDALEPLDSLLKRYADRPAPSASSSASQSTDTTDIDSELDSESLSDSESDVESADTDVKPLVTHQSDLLRANSDAAACQPTGVTLETVRVRTPVPALLRGRLREYQHVALDWLANLHQKRLNAVLADESGLGKTVETIALLLHLCERGVWGPHLIVVPTGQVLRWRIEFIRWAPAFKLLVYGGSSRERRELRQRCSDRNAFHICITSYALALQDRAFFCRTSWKYLILDEALRIKNLQAQRWQPLFDLRSRRRLLLTGSPLPSSAAQLRSLLQFMLPKADLAQGSEGGEHDAVRRLQQQLKPFVLRRLKADVAKQMPDKFEHVLRCPLASRQRVLYDDLLAHRPPAVLDALMSLRKVCDHPYLVAPPSASLPFLTEPLQLHMRCLLLPTPHAPLLHHAALSRLCDNELHLDKHASLRVEQLRASRQLIEQSDSADTGGVSPARCNKPLLPLVPANPFAIAEMCRLADIGLDDATSIAPSFMNRHADRRLEPAAEIANRALDAAAREHAVRVNEARCTNLQPLYGTSLRSLLLVNRSSVQQAVTAPDFDDGTTGVPNSCTLRGAVGYSHCLHALHVLPSLAAELLGPESLCACRSIRTWWTETAALHALVVTPTQRLHQMATTLQLLACTVPYCVAPPVRVDLRPRQLHTLYETQRTFASLIHCLPDTLERLAVAKRVRLPDPHAIQLDCGKLQSLDTLLRQLRATGRRVLLLTQMNCMLDVLEQFLSLHTYPYVRVDAFTSAKRRPILTTRFNEDSRICCMLMSTRVADLGVNMTGADAVVLYDVDWHPYMHALARERCRRIAQSRELHVYRLVSEGTVEENMLDSANLRRVLDELVIERGRGDVDSRLADNLFRSPGGREDLVVNERDSDGDLTSIASLFTQLLADYEDAEDAEAAKLMAEEALLEAAEFDEPAPHDIPTQCAVSAERPLSSDAKREAYAPDVQPIVLYDHVSIKMETEGPMWSAAVALPQSEHLPASKLKIRRPGEPLQPIEWYALSTVEAQKDDTELMDLDSAAAFERTKQAFELRQVIEWRREDELHAEFNDEEVLFGTRDLVDQMWYDQDGQELPIWTPPCTPPPTDDYYVDHSLHELYAAEAMTEDELPPLKLAAERKPKLRSTLDEILLGDVSTFGTLQNAKDAAANRNDLLLNSARRNAPRCLFDKPLAPASGAFGNRNVVRPGSTYSSQQSASKLKQSASGTLSMLLGSGVNKNAGATSTPDDAVSSDIQNGWTVAEDWCIVHAIVRVHEQVIAPAIAPTYNARSLNWELIADFVNSSAARVYRSARLCRSRFEKVLEPRGGKLMCEGPAPGSAAQSKKQKQRQAKLAGNATVMHSVSHELLGADCSMAVARLHVARFAAITKCNAKRETERAQLLTFSHTASQMRSRQLNANPGDRQSKTSALMAVLNSNGEPATAGGPQSAGGGQTQLTTATAWQSAKALSDQREERVRRQAAQNAVALQPTSKPVLAMHSGAMPPIASGNMVVQSQLGTTTSGAQMPGNVIAHSAAHSQAQVSGVQLNAPGSNMMHATTPSGRSAPQATVVGSSMPAAFSTPNANNAEARNEQLAIANITQQLIASTAQLNANATPGLGMQPGGQLTISQRKRPLVLGGQAGATSAAAGAGGSAGEQAATNPTGGFVQQATAQNSPMPIQVQSSTSHLLVASQSSSFPTMNASTQPTSISVLQSGTTQRTGVAQQIGVQQGVGTPTYMAVRQVASGNASVQPNSTTLQTSVQRISASQPALVQSQPLGTRYVTAGAGSGQSTPTVLQQTGRQLQIRHTSMPTVQQIGGTVMGGTGGPLAVAVLPASGNQSILNPIRHTSVQQQSGVPRGMALTAGGAASMQPGATVYATQRAIRSPANFPQARCVTIGATSNATSSVIVTSQSHAAQRATVATSQPDVDMEVVSSNVQSTTQPHSSD